MSGYRRFDDVEVGDVYPPQPLAVALTAALVDGFLAATGDETDLYGAGLASSEAQPRRAPSMIASVYLIDLLATRGSPPGGIHAKQSVRFHRPLAVGETLSLQARVVDKYVRKEKPYVVSDFEARGEDGALAATGRVTSIWGKAI
jgi:hypothetical protein